MKALVLGASGATGSRLLELLLQDEEIQQIAAFVRRPLKVRHEKLHQHSVDFESPETWKSLVDGDVLFSCLGTTLKTAGSKAAQWKIDYDYQYQFARIASENKVKRYVLVSASNASVRSPFFYGKMKGQLEEDVKLLAFQKLVIFKPPLLMRENTDRPMEIYGARMIRFLNHLGMLKAQKPVHVRQLAEAMLKSAKTAPDGIRVIQAQKIVSPL